MIEQELREAVRNPFLGEIETEIVGMQGRKATIEPGEQINLEREAKSPQDRRAIRVENGKFEPVGYLPRKVASWLSTLVNEHKIHLDGYIPQLTPAGTDEAAGRCPVVLMVFQDDMGAQLLEKTPPANEREALHQTVLQAYQNAQAYRDPELVLGLARGLQPLEKGELLPQTRLLLALLPRMGLPCSTMAGFAIWQLSATANKLTFFERKFMVTFRLNLSLPRGLPYCGVVDYARILSRCYLQRTTLTMAEQLPLVRQWILLRTLCSRRYGVTIKDIMHKLGVSEKTVRRDLEVFQQVGFPLKESVGEFGRKTWQIEADKVEPGLSFAFDEAIALYLGRRFLEPLAGTAFWEAAQRAFRRFGRRWAPTPSSTSTSSARCSTRHRSGRRTTRRKLS